MDRARFVFRECLVNAQKFNCNSEHMVSRVFFDFEIKGTTVGLYADVKEPVCGGFEVDTIEVSTPKLIETNNNYSGVFNYNVFRDGAEKYYRDLIGSQGSMIRISEEHKDISLTSCCFRQQKILDFDVSETVRL